MIVFLRGEVFSSGLGYLDLDVQGVGYRVYVTEQLASEARVGETRFIYTYQHVREDAVQLFGFTSEGDRALFELLLSVSGIGPKVALQVLGATTAEAFAEAVAAEDVAALCELPGVGKKTAQRMLVELKDKVDDVWLVGSTTPRAARPAATLATPLERDAVEALVALGYHEKQAVEAVQQVLADGAHSSVEETLRQSLQLLYQERAVR